VRATCLLEPVLSPSDVRGRLVACMQTDLRNCAYAGISVSQVPLIAGCKERNIEMLQCYENEFKNICSIYSKGIRKLRLLFSDLA